MLSWTNLNPTVKIVATKKKFFNNYLYKVVVWCPGGRLINSRLDQDAEVLLSRRIKLLSDQRTYNYGGSWFSSMATIHGKELEANGRADQLQHLINIKQQYKDRIKIRIEEPNVGIYCNDEGLLYSLMNANYLDRIKEVHRPMDDRAVDVLNRGEIITKKEPEFAFKVVLRDFVFADKDVKINILDHLYNLDKDDQVCLTKGITKHLGSSLHYFPGGYFYAKDEQTMTFVNLICPGLISGIFKLTKLD